MILPCQGMFQTSLCNHPAGQMIAMHHKVRKRDLTTWQWGVGEVLYNKITS